MESMPHTDPVPRRAGLPTEGARGPSTSVASTADDPAGVPAAVHEAVASVQQALLWGLGAAECRSLALDAFLEVTDSQWAALVHGQPRGALASLHLDVHRRPPAHRGTTLVAGAALAEFLAFATPYATRALAAREPATARLPAPTRERIADRDPSFDPDWLAVLPIPASSGPASAVLLVRRGAAYDDSVASAVDPLLRLTGQVDTWVREVEARRRTEHELGLERRRLQLALSASDIGVFEFDPATGSFEWDERLWQMHGLARRDTRWTFDDWAALLHPADAQGAVDDLRVALAQRRALQTQYRIVRRDGEVRHVRANAQVFDEDGNPRVVGVIIDVTADVRLQQELAAERAQAEAATRAKSQFLATMSHEIRTPMNGVLGMLESLLRSGLAPEQHERAALAHGSAECLLRILNDILDLSRLESHQVTIEAIPFEPAQVIAGTVAVLMPRAAEKRLRLLQEIDAGVPAWISGDPMRLRQVLMNLIGNAVKFTAEGHVSVRVRVDHDGPRPLLRVDVSDTGEGIPVEAQDRLFDRFVQADSSTSRRFGGSGLGLAISRQLVGLMGGQIGLHSEPGRGSTFWFVIPIVATGPPPTAAVREGARSTQPAAPATPLRILAVDDNAVNRRVLQAFLTPAGHRVRLVEGGTEALEALAVESFDVVLLDVQMPIMDGPTCLRHVRSLDPPLRDIPVIAVTANAMAGDRERYLAEGFSDYVSKPMTMQGLADAIARVTRPRSSTR